MSYWGVHVGFAAIVTTLVVAGLGLPRRQRWAIVGFSGFWAVVPDLYHFVPGIESWYKPLVHDSWVSNLFWLHRVIDRVDPGDEVVFAVAGWLSFLVVFLAVEYRLDRDG